MTEFEKLQAIIADVLNVSPETITPDTTFVDDLGADSLDIFQIIMGIEEVLTSRSITKRQRRSQQCRMLLIRSRKRRLMNNQIVR